MRVIIKLFYRVCSILFCLLGCLSTLTYASQSVRSNDSWYAGIGGGTTWISLPSNTTVPNGSGAAPPSDVDTFSIHNPSANLYQFVAGYHWSSDQYIPYYHLFFQYRHYINTDIKGVVTQYSLPGFENYNYKVSYESDLFTLTGKFDLIQYKMILPYLSAGIGTIYNHLNDYEETALSGVTPRTNPNYQGVTQPKLAVTLGAGLDCILTDNFWLTLGYEHVFQGNLKTGLGTGSWSSTALNIGNAKMDTIFINFSANIPDSLRFRS